MNVISKENPLRIMLVDDSSVIRGIFSRAISADPNFKIVASVADGQMALNNINLHDVEIVVLDIEMPVMDGITALPKLIQAKPDAQIIMASTLTRRNAEISIRALELGAKDYIPKPESTRGMIENDFQKDLNAKIKALGEYRRRHFGQKEKPIPTPDKETLTTKPAFLFNSNDKNRSQNLQLRKSSVLPPDIIAIGSSTGGPQALTQLLKNFPKEISLPILITQHMPPTFTAILAEHLTKDSGIACKEAQDGDLIEPRKAYVAPGGKHMIVVTNQNQKRIKITDTEAENFCKPSVDPMLRSMAEIYGPKILTIILTGMGSDGLKGSQIVVEKGGTIIAQDEASSVVWGMPGAVSMAGLCSAILPLNEIASKIQSLTFRSVA